MLRRIIGEIEREIGINQNVSAWRVNQVYGQIRCADIVEIAGDLEAGEFKVPQGLAGQDRARRWENQERKQRHP